MLEVSDVTVFSDKDDGEHTKFALALATPERTWFLSFRTNQEMLSWGRTFGEHSAKKQETTVWSTLRQVLLQAECAAALTELEVADARLLLRARDMRLVDALVRSQTDGYRPSGIPKGEKELERMRDNVDIVTLSVILRRALNKDAAFSAPSVVVAGEDPCGRPSLRLEHAIPVSTIPAPPTEKHSLASRTGVIKTPVSGPLDKRVRRGSVFDAVCPARASRALSGDFSPLPPNLLQAKKGRSRSIFVARAGVAEPRLLVAVPDADKLPPPPPPPADDPDATEEVEDEKEQENTLRPEAPSMSTSREPTPQPEEI
ncbi:MAG: hypothetical protein MHM6MM_000336 [Cercozoa sp. M6MM]